MSEKTSSQIEWLTIGMTCHLLLSTIDFARVTLHILFFCFFFFLVLLLFCPLHQSGKDLSLLLKLSKVGALTTADGKSFQ
jgi:hypothetical protein